jgi:O-antigen ligase
VAAPLLLVGIEAVLAAVCYVLAKRQWDRAVLYLVAMTAPLEVYRTGLAGVNLSLFRLALLAAGIGLFLDSARRRVLRTTALRMVTARLPLAYLGLAALMTVSVAFVSDNSFLGKRLVALVLVGALAIVLIGELTSRLSVITLLRAFAFGAVLPILAASLQGLAPKLGTVAHLPFLSRLPAEAGLEKTRDAAISFGGLGIRVKGTFGDPNHYGVYLALILVIALGLLVLAVLARQRPQAVSFGALVVAATASLVATYSRTGWMAAGLSVLALAALLLPLARSKPRSRRSNFVALSSAVVLILAFLPVAPGVITRLNPSSSINNETNTSHQETTAAALKQFEQHPVFGIGAAGLGVVLDQGPRTSGAHSTFVTVAAELGLVGLLSLLLAAAFAVDSLGRVFWRNRLKTSGVVPATLLASYAGFLAANVTYDLWWDDFHWVILGGVVALAQSAPRRVPVNRRAIGRLPSGRAA